MEKENDILFLFFNNPQNNNIFLEWFNRENGIRGECVFKPVGILCRIIRRFHLYSGLPGIGIWFYQWHKEIRPGKKIVCIASKYSPRILKWIKKKEPSVMLINYYWDSIAVSRYPVKEYPYYKNYTFCKKDSKQYAMLYNPQFYISSMKLPTNKLKYDISFIGSDREGVWEERAILVNQYYQLLKQKGFHLFFYFVTKKQECPEEIRKQKWLTEEEYYKVVAESRVVLEIVNPEEEWITLRPLLALSNGKKLISNNRSIVEEAYYSKENIFILGLDKEQDLFSFINKPFTPIAEEILAYYDVQAWSKRFFTKRE